MRRFLPSTPASPRRGQAMVEFALVLPLLVLLLVMAIDFGRIFFGSVGLHNAARIAANAAASDPDAWSPPTIPSGQTAYQQVVVNELEALNCDPPPALDLDNDQTWDLGEVPPPTFKSMPTGFSLASDYEVGDHAVVDLNCDFELINPLATLVLGQNPVSMAASSEFMIRGGVINGIPIGPAPPPPGCVDEVVPNLVGQSVAAARISWAAAGFTGGFVPASGFDTEIVSAQATSPPSSPNDCLVATASVTVTHAPAGGCTAPDIQVPNLVGLTVAQARSTWAAAGFTGSFTPAAGSDTEIVGSQTTVPASTPGSCEDPSTTVTVTHAPPPPPQCTMPDLRGLRVNDADDDFVTAGFTGSYTISRPPSGNYTITSQLPVGGQEYDCTSGVIVAGN